MPDQVDDRGRLVYNPDTHQTNVPGVFAAGEIVTAVVALSKTGGEPYEEYLALLPDRNRTAGLVQCDEIQPESRRGEGRRRTRLNHCPGDVPAADFGATSRPSVIAWITTGTPKAVSAFAAAAICA